MPAENETALFDRTDPGGSGPLDDPKLPDLMLALDPSRMARRFEDHFRASGMAAGWHGDPALPISAASDIIGRLGMFLLSTERPVRRDTDAA